MTASGGFLEGLVLAGCCRYALMHGVAKSYCPETEPKLVKLLGGDSSSAFRRVAGAA